MRNHYTYLTIALLVLFTTLSNASFAQKAFYFGPDASVNKNDTIVLQLKEYVGEQIQWQRSFDKIDWEDITGANQDVLEFEADTTSYFRAKVIAGNCDPFYSDTTLVGVYKMDTNVVVIDDYEVELISDSTQIANGVFIYSGDLSGIVEIGSVLVSSEGQGYIRVVTDVNPQKDETTILTEGGDLTDVFDELDLEDSFVVTMSDSEKAFEGAREIPLELTYLIPGAKMNIEKNRFNFSGANFHIEVTDPIDPGVEHTVSATVTNGSIHFEPIFERIIEIGYVPVRVERFGLVAGGDIDYELDLLLESDFDLGELPGLEDEILLSTFVIGPIFIGPVPMFVDYELKGKFECGINFTSEISFGFKSGYTAAFGAIYERDQTPQWSSIWEAGNKPFEDEYLESNITGNAYASLGVVNQFNFTIAKVAGPYLSLKPYLRGDLSLSVSPPEWGFLLSMGLENKLGFEVKIVSKKLADYYIELPGLNWEIYETGGVFEATPPVIETLAVTNVTSTTALSGGNVTDDGGATVSARGVVWSTSPDPTIENNEGFTDDGNDLGEFSSEITGLTPETPYYIKAYATNIAGTGYGEELSFTTLNDSPNTYALNLLVSPAGSGQVGGMGSFYEGASLTINAYPNEGFQFVNWTGDINLLNDPNSATATLTMPGYDVNLTANFISSGSTQVVEVLNPATGKIWMDRNLGASRAATASNDAEAYGDLYQWGRAADGHQLRTSPTTSTLSNSDNPGHGNFILAPNYPYDWRSPQNNNLWQGVNGINNPCPAGYRLPTIAELDAERLSWSSNNSAGAFASPLKLPVGGYRYYTNGSLRNVGSYGYYWSSSVDGIGARYLFFDSSNANTDYSFSRAYGFSVRCLKDSESTTFSLNLYVSPEGSGQVTGTGEYTEGETVTITATPNENFQFVNWTGDINLLNDPNSATATLTMPGYDVNLTANFISSGSTQVVEVLNPATGKIWMDRNLGASRAATASNDAEAYGHLYQWGRAADGHQLRTSPTTSTLSYSDNPGHGNFILAPNSPYDWRSPQNNNLWQGVNGINNPCPAGYRLPTIAELDAERLSWSTNNATGAFNSPLKLPVGGLRDYYSGPLNFVGSNGYYWSSTVDGIIARSLYFSSSNAYTGNYYYRAYGFSVRCLKDSESTTFSLNLYVSPEGSGQVTGTGEYTEGETVTITATPNENFQFVNWTGDINLLNDPNSATATLTMPGYDVSLTANFELINTPDWPTDTETEVVEVLNPATGKIWMDRNLGASRAATASNDAEAYGDLYQWGRAADGHQLRTSPTTSTLSNSDNPGHGNFILAPNSPYDWRSPQNDNLWQGVNGINNPCPAGYRLPTIAELDAERLSWSTNNATGAFNSPLKLPVGGYRYSSSGSLSSVGSYGYYWSGTVDGLFARRLNFRSSYANTDNYNNRAYGLSVRCLKD